MARFGRLRGLSTSKRAHRDGSQEAEELRDLSDQSHPLYDPLLDPELRLRVVRTAADSIHESLVEDDRRRATRRLSLLRRKEDRASSSSHTNSNSALRRKMSLFTRNRASSEAHSADSSHTQHPTSEIAHMVQGELEKNRRTAHAAAEAEECAQRQHNVDSKADSEPSLKRKKKVKPRRSIYVNMQGGATDPKGYERNKVRTSKYTLLSFLPKVFTIFSCLSFRH